MTGLIVILCFILISVITIQIGKVTELAEKIRGEEESQLRSNQANGRLWLIFGFLFLVGTVWSAIYYQNWMLGYGPHDSASEHGHALDNLFNITLVFTGIVFIITHILLFWYSYKYSGKPGRKVYYQVHDTKLEVIWTAIPAVVMALLVMGGLDAWNEVMADIEPGEDFMEIEATGMQFAWILRYPGADGKLGSRNYKKIDSANPLGQVWSDTKNLDDIHPGEIVLPKGKKVRVRIMARDVLHNFDLPHFRVKMDAVPGIPTYFVFTPTTTTEEYRARLKEVPEYQQPSDEADPDGPKLWETFEFELACAELCGKGHFSMRKLVRIVEQDEYDEWIASQQPYYLSSIRGTDGDPYKDDVSPLEVSMRKTEFDTKVRNAMASDSAQGKIVVMDYVNFQTGSANLTPLSKYELSNVVNFMNKNGQVTIEVAGHTDSMGDLKANQSLSQARAEAVYNFLSENGVPSGRMNAVGYGPSRPMDSNETEEGRAKNRRTEFQILTQ